MIYSLSKHGVDIRKVEGLRWFFAESEDFRKTGGFLSRFMVKTADLKFVSQEIKIYFCPYLSNLR